MYFLMRLQLRCSGAAGRKHAQQIIAVDTNAGRPKCKHLRELKMLPGMTVIPIAIADKVAKRRLIGYEVSHLLVPPHRRVLEFQRAENENESRDGAGDRLPDEYSRSVSGKSVYDDIAPG